MLCSCLWVGDVVLRGNGREDLSRSSENAAPQAENPVACDDEVSGWKMDSWPSWPLTLSGRGKDVTYASTSTQAIIRNDRTTGCARIRADDEQWLFPHTASPLVACSRGKPPGRCRARCHCGSSLISIVEEASCPVNILLCARQGRKHAVRRGVSTGARGGGIVRNVGQDPFNDLHIRQSAAGYKHLPRLV